MSETVLTEVADRIAVVTLNRPQSRNALNSELLRALPEALAAADADDEVDVVILTGADPAFSAGLDLKELGSTGGNIGAGTRRDAGSAGDGGRGPSSSAPWAPLSKPLIGAVNGPAVTGGFELALNCDFLVASERARFADTHARVGIVPGWGLSVLLPQAVGVRKAREMSLTGNYLDAEQALQFGLVNHVVPHDQLLAFTRTLATDIVSNDQRAARTLLDLYRQVSATTVEEGLRIEARVGRGYHQGGFDPAEVEARREAIVQRGRAQQRA